MQLEPRLEQLWFWPGCSSKDLEATRHDEDCEAVKLLADLRTKHKEVIAWRATKPF